MAQVLKATMTRGEITPLAHARVDIEMYQAAVEKLYNFFVVREGGARRRSGTRYRGRLKFADKGVRLVDFSYLGASYVLEFGDSYLRFWTEFQQVLSAGIPYELVSPYTEADLRGVQWVQSGNALYIAFRSMTIKPQKLIRTSSTSWAFSDVDFKDGPYLPINDVQNAVTPSAAPVSGSPSTLTFANVSNINNGAGFVATDVGRHIRVQFDGNWSWGTITTVTDVDEVDVTWVDGNGGTTASLTWRLGAFSDTTGYPGSVAIYEGRLVWGSTPTSPRYVGYSYSNLPEVYTPSDIDGTVTDANGGAYDIISGDEILWLQDAPRLQIGMPRSVRSLGASDLTQQFGPRNVSVKAELSDGVGTVKPVVVGPSTIHTTRFSRAFNDLIYDYSANALIAPELSSISEHLFDPTITDLVFQSVPHRRLWAVVGDGSMTCTTIDRYEKVVGFSQHVFTSGAVFAATSIPGDAQDELYLAVQREIDGSLVAYMETLDIDFLRGELKNAYFMDCGYTYTGPPATSITGIDWLLNTEVDVFAHGEYIGRRTVSGAGVLTLPTLPTLWEKVSFGLPMVAEGELLPVPLNVPEGSSLGRRLRVVSVEVDVYETLGLKVRSDRDVLTLISDRPADKDEQSGQTADTGTYRVLGDGDWRSRGKIGWVCDQPLPATIRAFNIKVEAE